MDSTGVLQAVLLVLAMAELTTAQLGVCPVTDSHCVCNFDAHKGFRSIDCTGLGPRDTLPVFNASTEIIPTLRIENSSIYRLHTAALQGLRIRNLLLNDIKLSIVEPYALRGLESYLESLEIKNSDFVSLPDFFLFNFTSLKTIALDQNRLDLVKSNWFMHLNSLQYLIMSSNMIRDIEAGSFHSMPDLRVLYLSENKLTYLNEGTFSKLTELKVLGLGSNNLTVLPLNIFDSLGKVEWLDLNRNQLTMFPDGLFKGMHSIKELYASSNSIQEIRPTNLPAVSTLEVLILSNNNISVLRDSSFNNVINLRKLALDHNYIDKLPDLAFENLPALDSLQLQDNQIGELPQNILVGLLQLTELNLKYNNIRVLTYGIFDPLGKLVWLDISNNLLTIVHFGPFDALRTLTYVDMSRNRLSHVEANWFRKSKALIQLRLNHNGIRSIEDSTFAKMPNLQELYLEHNYIQVIKPGMFAETKKVRVLSLFHNPLKFVPAGSFGSMRQLENLYLNYTCITAIPNQIFINLTKVKDLRLDHTPIGVIESYSFAPLKGLRTLILGYHNLTKIEARPLIHVRDIIKFAADNMRLSPNNLTNLLFDLPKAKQISLKHNLILSLHKDAFSSNPQLQKLSLAGNPLVCDCQLGWLRSFEPLEDIEKTACTGPDKLATEMAACFPLPASCPPVASLPSVIERCQLPPSVDNKEIEELDYEHCVVPPEPTTPRPTTITTTATTTIGPIVMSVSTNESQVVVSWERKTNPNILGYRVTYRVFATNTSKSSPDLSNNDTTYYINDMVPGLKYFVCVDIKLVSGYLPNEAECKEINFNYGISTIYPPSVKPVEAKSQLPLLVIVGASAAAILVTFVIIVVIVCCLRKTKTRFAENAKRKEDRDQMVKDKMGMWVNTFNYDGNVQESMGEQMMLDYDLFSGNNPTVSKARYAQMLADKGMVIPDVLVVGDEDEDSTSPKAFNLGDDMISNKQDGHRHTDVPGEEYPGDISGSDPGYGESETGYNGSDSLHDDNVKDDSIMF